MRAEVQIWIDSAYDDDTMEAISNRVFAALTEGPSNDPMFPWFARQEIEKIRVTTFIEDLINAGTSNEEEKTKQRMEVK